MARSNDDYPGNTPGVYVAAILSLVHYGAIALVLLSLVSGALLVGHFRLVGLVLLSLAGLILAVQIISRLRHIRYLDRVRRVHGMVEIWSDELEAWIPEHRITRITRKQLCCPHAWRPITVVYPGIEVCVTRQREPIPLLYPPGADELRDRMFDYLTARHPAAAGTSVPEP